MPKLPAADYQAYLDERTPASDGLAFEPIAFASTDGVALRGWFLPGDQRLIFASTHGDAPECPPTPPFTPGKYQWPVYQGYDLYTVKLDGSDPARALLRQALEASGRG